MLIICISNTLVVILIVQIFSLRIKKVQWLHLSLKHITAINSHHSIHYNFLPTTALLQCIKMCFSSDTVAVHCFDCLHFGYLIILQFMFAMVGYRGVMELGVYILGVGGIPVVS